MSPQRTVTQRLDEARVLHAAILSASWDRFHGRQNRRECFIAYMVEVYHYVKFACPLMRATVERLGLQHSAARDYLRHHIEEETDHDLWMLDDLNKLGYDRALIRASLPMPQTVALIGIQEYVIRHLNPLGYFGYIFAMESSTSSREVIERLARQLELPVDAMSTFLEHAQLDLTSHVAALREAIDASVTREEDQNLVVWNYCVSMEQVSELILAIERRDDIQSSLSRLVVDRVSLATS